MSKSLQHIFDQSLALYQAGRMIEARSGYKKILKNNPVNADVLHLVGLTYIRTQDYQKGLASIQQALLIKPDKAEAHYNLGNAYAELGQVDEAIAAYKQALRIKPDYWNANLNLGNVFNALKRTDEAIACYQQALITRPDLAEAYNGLGVAFGEEKNFEAAVEAYRHAISVKPNFADAYNNLGVALNELGQCDEAITSYKNAVIFKPTYADAYIGLANVLIKQKRFEQAVDSYKSALEIQPDIESAYKLGGLLNQLRRFDEAIPFYELAISLKPDFADAYNELGIALTEIFKIDEANDAYRHALRLEPDHCGALNNLGNALINLDKHEEAISYYKHSLSLFPNHVEAEYNMGVALSDLNEFGESLSHFERALSIKPDFIEAIFNRGNLLLSLGQFEQGWLDYEMRGKCIGSIPLPQSPYPRWSGEYDISGKQLLIQYEQGFGDLIQIVRYVNLLSERNIRCWIQVKPALQKLFSCNFPNALVIDVEEFPEHIDYSIPAMSLPLAMKTFSEAAIPKSIPYLIADSTRIDYWKKQLSSASVANVGLVWRGNSGHKNDRNRSIALAEYISLILANPSVQFVTLQKDLTVQELDQLKLHNNVRILDEELTDFDETAAVMSNLDLVITVDSAPAHLAGALGIPIWILLCFAGEWRWLHGRTDSPWYPSATIFRQSNRGNWAEVIEEVNHELARLGEVVNEQA